MFSSFYRSQIRHVSSLNQIFELVDIHYDEHFEKWNKSTYTVDERRIMLTKWVRQA
jgi:hypothetical protein